MIGVASIGASASNRHRSSGADGTGAGEKPVSDGGPAEFTVSAAEPSGLQSLTGWDGKAYIGELVAVPAEPHRDVPLSEACDAWIDSYESTEAP